jgi:hypothetical protein
VSVSKFQDDSTLLTSDSFPVYLALKLDSLPFPSARLDGQTLSLREESGGEYSFTVKVSEPFKGYKLVAASPGFTSAVSEPFDIDFSFTPSQSLDSNFNRTVKSFRSSTETDEFVISDRNEQLSPARDSRYLKSFIYLDSAPSANLVINPFGVTLMAMESYSYYVKLLNAPSSTVTITITKSGTYQAVLNILPSSFTLSSSDYYIGKKITIYASGLSGVTNLMLEDIIVTHTISSSDSKYSSLSAQFEVNVINICKRAAYYWPSGSGCYCPNGYECSGDYVTRCPAGSYNNDNSISCTTCPSGKYCLDPEIAPTDCPTGYYSYIAQVECIKCPPGWACPSRDGSGNVMCTPGTYSLGGSTSCTTCPAGNMCPSSEDSPLGCKPGTYSAAGSLYCIECPAGYYCSTTTSSPIACTSGYYALPGATSCTACPANTECDTTRGPIRVCEYGTYLLNNKCTACTAGKYCDSSGTPQSCPSGTYSFTGSSTCMIIPPGYKSDGSDGITQCPTGQYSIGGQATCAACTSGTYADKVGSFKCEPCPPGYSCATTTAAPIICPYGTYSSGLATACTDCADGYVCVKGSTRPDPIGYECPPGHYCAGGTVSQCVAGKYNPFVRQSTIAACQTCPSGYDCIASTGDFSLRPCQARKYCPAGINTSCPAGTYSAKENAVDIGECYPCPPGQYCDEGVSYGTECPEGYFCPQGTTYDHQYPCPSGTYGGKRTGLKSIEDCLICPAGHYCPRSVGCMPDGTPTGCNSDTNDSSIYVDPIPCTPGTYNIHRGAYSSKNCLPCPAGYACPDAGTVEPHVLCIPGYYCTEGTKYPSQHPCPAGTKNNKYGAISVTECERCDEGKACKPGTGHGTLAALDCTAGYYCPLRTEYPNQWPCPAGTYTDKTYLFHISQCSICPKGKYCIEATVNPETCLAGYYCPYGTKSAKQYPCPEGTYSSLTGLEKIEDCSTTCPKGKYCPAGSTAAINCPAGTYNDETGATSRGPGGDKACKECPGGYICATAGLESPTLVTAGHYSPPGAKAEINCPAGHTCPGTGTSEDTMIKNLCPAGTLCPAESTSTLDAFSLLCPKGKYCTEGAPSATDCPVGTYRNFFGGKSESDCLPTPAGFYADTVGTDEYEANECDAGHYCPEGSTSATQYKCPPGTYRASTKGRSADDCAKCEPGYYCPEWGTKGFTAGALEVKIQECPVGYYCPESTIVPVACPRGSYSNTKKLKSSNECTKCDPGKYCADQAMTTFTGDCVAGYYCSGGAWVSAPPDDDTGGLCPSGSYCPAGVATPTPCPAGKFNNYPGGVSTDDCVSCPPGYYCLGDGLPTPTGQCTAGYYCTGGSSSATQNTAAAGYYTTAGSVSQIPCPRGTYNPSTAQASCSECPAGSFCNNEAMITTTTCEPGYYCPQGSYTQIPCPPGTFRSTSGAASLDECAACTGGKYCEGAGNSAVTGNCAAGYYCIEGSPYQYPYIEDVPCAGTPCTSVSGNFGPCIAGYYCPPGTIDPQPCSAGTYMPTRFAEAQTDCLPCPAGWACESTGMYRYDVVQCRAGYFCTEGSTQRAPDAGICPVGHYCVAGSAVALPCVPGTYQNSEGQTSCEACSPGKYCPSGSSDITNNVCPKGYYCPEGTTYPELYPCPIGTYNMLVGQTSSDACIGCPTGYYCPYEAFGDDPKDATTPYKCAAGFYCTGGSPVAKPAANSGYGGRCVEGEYCPEGSSAAIKCDPGYYCPNQEMAAPKGACKGGYYCIEGATKPTPTDGVEGDICSEQNYCPPGSYQQSNCPAGTYLPYEGASSLAECQQCPAGYYCDGGAISIQPCTAGYYCEGGDITPSKSCETGTYCPQGSAAPVLCAAGTYQDETRQSTCKACTAGNFCEEGAISQTTCPEGYYCPAGTTYRFEYPCPIGKYNDETGMTADTDCKSCPAGKYCDSLGAASFTSNCSEGYYCIGGAVSAKPTDASQGGICPKGTYCEAGAKEPKDCDPGFYCDREGLSVTSASCLAGYVCVGAAFVPNPIDGTTGDVCSAGKYCLEQSSAELDCPPGTYSPSIGLGDPEKCIECSYGKYCDDYALITPAGDCAPGFFCDPGKTTSEPAEGICLEGFYCPEGSAVQIPCDMGYYNNEIQRSECDICEDGSYCTGEDAQPSNCPKGYECPEGTRFDKEFPCPDGTYSDVEGLGQCKECPPGRECNSAAETALTPCPVYKYCPARTGWGIICPAGYYNLDSEGLEAGEDCLPCPSGNYCVDGKITDQCAPGYFCELASPTPTPDGTQSYGRPCPPGFYCIKGASAPAECPLGKFRKDTGARQESDCTDCPPGYYCIREQTTPIICPIGNYCPQGSQAPVPCPIRTYNPNEGKSDTDDCLVCPGGFLCDEEGIGVLLDYPCELGKYCVEGALETVDCPPGTYSLNIYTAYKEMCTPCPKGKYCIGGTEITYDCFEGTYCDGGASYPRLCTVGDYCPKNTGDPIPCPTGYYCPVYNYQFAFDQTYEIDPTVERPPFKCPSRYFCPMGSIAPSLCRAGTTLEPSSHTCKSCPAGKYSNNFSESICKDCDPGYLCIEEAIRPDPRDLKTDGGYPCPAGYYCPAASVSPIPCPIRTYNPYEGQVDSSACLPSPANTYADKEGMARVFHCGSHATSAEGSTICTCNGAFRSFSKGDGSCRCVPTYEYFINGEEKSEEDSSEDCTPKVYNICQSGYSLDVNGDCKEDDDCEDECGGKSGNRVGDTGLCECEGEDSLDSYCDSGCRENASIVKFMGDKIIVTDGASKKSKTYSSSELPGYIDKSTCSSECTVYSIDFESGDINSYYGLSKKLQSISRRLQESTSTSSSIPNPVYCLQPGDTFLFTFNTQYSYPVYNKNSFINSNPNFDYSAFKELEYRMSKDIARIQYMSFTFNEVGIYDFVDKYDKDNHIIIGVVGEGETCDAPIMPRNEDSLGMLGAKKLDNVMTDPDWSFIAGLIISLFILMILLVLGFAFAHWRAWASTESKEKLFALMKNCFSRCRPRRVMPIDPKASSINSEEESLEDGILSPQTFENILNKLRAHREKMHDQFNLASSDSAALLNQLLQEAEEHKNRLKERLNKIDPDLLKAKLGDIPMNDTMLDEDSLISDDESDNTSMRLATEKSFFQPSQEDEKKLEIVVNNISENPDLNEQEKEEMLRDYEANISKMHQSIENERNKAVDNLNKRLQDRASRRRAALREKQLVDAQSQQMLERHRNENRRLEDDYNAVKQTIDQEHAKEREKIKKELRKDADEKLKNLREKLQSELDKAKSPEEIDFLMEAYKIEEQRVEKQLNEAKKKQEEDLLRRLEERRKKKLEKLNKKSDEKKEVLDKKHEQESEAMDKKKFLNWDDVQFDLDVPHDDVEAAQQLNLVHENEKGKLDAKHIDQLYELDKQLYDPLEEKVKEKNILEQQLGQTVSEDEKNKLLQQIMDLDNTINTDFSGQQASLKDRLRERQRLRAERQAELLKQQAEEKALLQNKHFEEATELLSELEVKKIENVLDMNKHLSPEQLATVARKMLDDKHQRELNDIVERKHEILKEKQTQTLDEAVHNKMKTVSDIKERFSIKREEIANLPEDKRKKELEKLNKLEEDALLDAEYDYINYINSCQDQITRDTEDQFRNKFLEINDRHLQETSQLLKKISDANPKLIDAHIKDAAAEIERLKSEAELDYAQKLRELDEKRARIRKVQRAKEKEIEDMHKELDEIDAQHQKLLEVERRRQEFEDKQRKLREELEAKGISKEEIANILKNYENEVGYWEDAMSLERARQQDIMRKKLEDKREQQQHKIAARIEEYKKENIKIMKKNELNTENKLKIVRSLNRELQLYEPLESIETALDVPMRHKDHIVGDTRSLDIIIEKVARIEKIVGNIDLKQFEELMKGFEQVQSLIKSIEQTL